MKILVPVDGSPLSLDAVRHALWLIRQGLRAELLLANVQPPASLYEIVLAHDPDVIKDVSHGAGAHLLEPARALCRAAGVPFECEVLSGDPLRAICELAEERNCAQIVVGAHGKGALASMVRGSFSHALVQSAPVPVTVVKAGERAAVPASIAVAAQPRPDELRPH
jgi:nucleotide-binding universal stress UspA family protein